MAKIKKLGYYESKLKVDPERLFWNDKFSKHLANDNRQDKWKSQREKYGFDSRETWSLFTTIAFFIYPRLIYFKDHTPGFPARLTEEKWDKILSKMIFPFEQIVSGEYDKHVFDDEKYWKKYNRGLKLFYKYFNDLWS
jgi:hypothetical protein